MFAKLTDFALISGKTFFWKIVKEWNVDEIVGVV
jgi:hypothetical protein